MERTSYVTNLYYKPVWHNLVLEIAGNNLCVSDNFEMSTFHPVKVSIEEPGLSPNLAKHTKINSVLN